MDIVKKWFESSLILKIVIGLIIGAILGFFVPNWSFIGFFGDIFVAALKAIAPILVFLLVVSAISNSKSGFGSKYKRIFFLFLFTNFLAAVVGVVICYIFPLSIPLSLGSSATVPGGLEEVLGGMILNIFNNPIKSLSEGEYLGILFWSGIFGFTLKSIASDTTKSVIQDITDVVTRIVNIIIQFAPFGVMSLVFTSVSQSGLHIFTDYGELVFIIVASILFIAFVINPIISFYYIRRNPFPLILTCLRESAITAFFSRSSAANIPINMRLCERLGLDKDFYSISIALGSTINTGGAAVTISVMTMVACHTLGIPVTLSLAIALCVISTFAACGASGVIGGSLLLIPMGCSLFAISQDISMQFVAVGFIISVIQDSFETALNSSDDVIYTAIIEYYDRAKKGLPLNFMGEFAKR